MASHRVTLPVAAAVVVAVFVASQPTNAATVMFQQGIDGYTGTVDTYLRGADPDTNFGGATDIQWDQSSNGFPLHGLLRFEGIFGNAPGQIPTNAPITSATLNLQEATGGSGDAVNLHRMLIDWDEDTETWNTMVNGVQNDDIEAEMDEDATHGAIIGNQLLSINVLTSLQAWQQDPSKNYGWVFLALGVDGVNVFSSEGTTPPKLTVTFVPLPAAAWMALPLLVSRGGSPQATRGIGDPIRTFSPINSGLVCVSRLIHRKGTSCLDTSPSLWQ